MVTQGIPAMEKKRLSKATRTLQRWSSWPLVAETPSRIWGKPGTALSQKHTCLCPVSGSGGSFTTQSKDFSLQVLEEHEKTMGIQKYDWGKNRRHGSRESRLNLHQGERQLHQQGSEKISIILGKLQKVFLSTGKEGRQQEQPGHSPVRGV